MGPCDPGDGIRYLSSGGSTDEDRNFMYRLDFRRGVVERIPVSDRGPYADAMGREKRYQKALAHIAGCREWITDDPQERIDYLKRVAREALDA
jgi:hypothetical protein